MLERHRARKSTSCFELIFNPATTAVVGFDARDLWEVERRLAMADPELRGFAYEGTTMAFTILDVMGRGRAPGSC